MISGVRRAWRTGKNKGTSDAFAPDPCVPLSSFLRMETPGSHDCLLYTSDAADERSSVDLGGRRIIKKKKQEIRENIRALKNIEREKNETQKK